VRLSSVDPFNLCGTLLTGDKVPAPAGNRILFRDGMPVATIIAGKSATCPSPAPSANSCTRI
jgi:ATP-dependent Lhr-like helicase